jgi:hypothetical protein
MNEKARRTRAIIVFELAIVLGASAVFLGPHTISLTTQLVIMGALIAFVNIQFLSSLKRGSVTWARAATAIKWLFTWFRGRFCVVDMAHNATQAILIARAYELPMVCASTG